jgi:hypothetical protein
VFCLSDYYINAAGSLPTPNLFGLILMNSGLQWEMHPAQLFGLEALALERNTRIDIIVGKEVTGEEARELGLDTKHTLMGIPIVPKQEYPMGLIRLMLNGKEVSRIEALAVPYGFGKFTEEECESERNKLAAIGYRSRFDTCSLPQ